MKTVLEYAAHNFLKGLSIKPKNPANAILFLILLLVLHLVSLS